MISAFDFKQDRQYRCNVT